MPATKNRDLASTELWQLSVERSRRRRVLAAHARKEQNRRKTASVAVSAAVAAAPVWPSVAGGGSLVAKADAATGVGQPDGRERVLLSFGDRSPAVAALQRELRILEDGIFGPQTEGAVRAFQKRTGLRATGEVDVRTWLALFPNDAIVAAPSSDAGTGGEPQWAAVSTPPTGEAPVAAGPATASATPAAPVRRPRAKTQRRERGKARAARSSAADALSGAGDSTGSPPNGGISPLSPPAHDAPAEGSPTPPGGGAPPAAPGAPEQVVPVPPRPVVPIAPRGNVGEMIEAMMAEANRIERARYSYRWGGGHNSGFTGPYDCSGAVSAVLHAAGLLRSPLVSGDFTRWGARGRGLVTIYANASHVYMSIKGRFFGTSRSNPGGGAGWFRGGPRPGFVVVHVPFERMKPEGRSIARKRAKRPPRRRANIRVPRPAPQQAPQPNRGSEAGGTPPATTYQPPATSTPTTPPTPAPPPPTSGTPVPPPAASPAPSGPAGQAPSTGSQPDPVSVTTPAGSVTVTPPPAPSAGGGNPSGGGSTPAAPTPGPAPAGSAPVSPPQGPPSPSAPAPGPAPSGSGAGASGAQEQPTPAQPPSGAPADPVGEVADGAVAGAGKAAGAVTSTLAGKGPAPSPPDSGEAAPSSG